jgi:hypothetical protein
VNTRFLAKSLNHPNRVFRPDLPLNTGTNGEHFFSQKFSKTAFCTPFNTMSEKHDKKRRQLYRRDVGKQAIEQIG